VRLKKSSRGKDQLNTLFLSPYVSVQVTLIFKCFGYFEYIC